MTRKKPIVSVGAVTAPVVRTGGQVFTGAFLIEGIELFLYDFPTEQQVWLTAVAAVALSWLQNFIEKQRGRKLIGP